MLLSLHLVMKVTGDDMPKWVRIAFIILAIPGLIIVMRNGGHQARDSLFSEL